MASPNSSGTVAVLAALVVCAIVAGATAPALASAPADRSLEGSGPVRIGVDALEADTLSIDTVAIDTDSSGSIDDTTESIDDTVDNTSEGVDETTESDGDTTDAGTDETTDVLEEADGSDSDITDDADGSIDDETDSTAPLSNATNETSDLGNATDGLENAAGELEGGTDDVENTSKDLENATDGFGNATDTFRDTPGELEGATDEPANGTGSFLAEPVGATTDALSETASGATSSVSKTVSSVTAADPTALSSAVAATVDDESPVGSALAGEEPTSQGPAKTASDAVLVGMLGAVSASAAAAGGAGAGGGIGAAGASLGGAGTAGASAAAGGLAGGSGSAGASAAGSGGLTGTASSAVANWSATGRRLLRRALAALPWELLPIFKYSRYDDSDPLENETRATIYETVESKPGCYLSELGEDAGVSLSTVRHHVQILEDEGLLTTAKVNGKRRYYPEETDAALQAALEEPAKRDVLEALSTLERPNNSQLASALDRDSSTITHHLSALEDDGLVVRERDGRSTVTELAPETKAALRGTEISSLEDASARSPAD
ncbi:helix-turn-helix domain-containing protein [Halostagnicola kamekurae]|uniref:Predicted transcriptional regulator, containsd two HTH domains n=1 Tax=Halostagnicola kamekurae TaxID=619731 RepID=A0A1I6QAJ6_9EURY|nr:helix-turn-helix domain-containing protein [Halostagnicola kamekurae]SFS49491.1 Predicted transcriptional regulator, containsd two HTH domains [Halostagnicola kamekurae]